MSKIEDARKTINEIDKEMAELFEKRMKAVKDVAEYKKENGLSILDSKREAEVIKNNANYINDDVVKEYYVSFIKEVMEIMELFY